MKNISKLSDRPANNQLSVALQSRCDREKEAQTDVLSGTIVPRVGSSALLNYIFTMLPDAQLKYLRT